MQFKSSAALKMQAASISLPKYDPVNPRGEDSHFINISAKTIGIADGFGGWKKSTGLEAGQFARMLMRNSETAVRKANEDLYEKIVGITVENYHPFPASGPSRIRLKITSNVAIGNAIQMGDIHPKKIIETANFNFSGTRNTLASSARSIVCKGILQEENLNPKKILMKAYSETKIEGSSTACLITVSGNKILRAVNVGDSGFVIVRGGMIVYRSPIQQHSFNKPYLLRMQSPNSISLAEEIEMEVELGDVIVAGTDGLFSNMHEAQLECALTESMKLGLSLKKIAALIATLARRNSLDPRAETPFSRAAKAVGYNHKGGKFDDITVVVAVILSSSGQKNQGFLKVAY